MQPAEQGVPPSEHAGMAGRRQLLVLLLSAVALGYYQRAAVGILVPMIREELRLTFPDVGYALASLALASIVGFLLMGAFIWREKSLLGYALLGILGGLGGLLTGASSRVSSFIVAGAIEGLAYGGLLLGAYRIVGGWFFRESHGLAIGLVFAVTQVIAPVTPFITMLGLTHFGWRSSWRILGAIWFVWVFLWTWLSRRSGNDLRPDQPRQPPTVSQIFKSPVTWAVVVGVSLATPLLSLRSVQLLEQLTELLKGDRPMARWLGAPLLFLPVIGSIAAGLISDSQIRKGWSAVRSRTTLITICGLLMSLPALFAFSRAPVFCLLVAILSVTAGQGMFTVLYTSLVDAVPGRGIVLGVALIGCLSGLTGKIGNMMTEPISDSFGSAPLLIGFSILALIAVWCVRSLTGKMPASQVQI